LKLVCLAVVQLGTNESIALGVKEVTTSQNDESTPKKNLETSEFGKGVAWN